MGQLHLVEDLSPGLRPVYESIRSLLAGATRDEARSRYRVGVHIVDVKHAADKYGTRAVEQLAHAVGSNVHTLYRCASVAECWSAEQLDALLRRTTRRGQPLSWSHLVVLAGVTTMKRRGELVDLALREELTVRELQRRVDERERGGEPRAHLVLQKFVKGTERWSRAAADLHAELMAELGVRQKADLGDSMSLIEEAIAAEEQLHGVVQKHLAKLRGERSRLMRRSTCREAAPVRPLRVAGVRDR